MSESTHDQSSPDPVSEAFFELHAYLPRQGPGSEQTTERLLRTAGPLPELPRVLDAGSGTGPAALLLARAAGARVSAVDLHEPFLAELRTEAERQGLGAQIATFARSMDQLDFPDHSFDVVWCEGAVYTVGFATALRSWRRLLAPGGVVVLTELEWSVPDPSAAARAFWKDAYPLRTSQDNTRTAQELGYRVREHWPLPESDWWQEYYTPLEQRAGLADRSRPGMAEAVQAAEAEIALRREHGADYNYAAYVLDPLWSPASRDR